MSSPPLSLIEHEAHSDPTHAELRVLARERSPIPISRFITGKFCEHLGTNINNGMLAQILHNPTFADEPFFNGRMSPDGQTMLHGDPEEIAGAIRRRAARLGWPEAAGEEAVEAYRKGLAAGWVREGSPEGVRVSPDTGPFGGRAQRIEALEAGSGVAQWTALPLHRIRRFEFTLVARTVGISALTVSLYAQGSAEPIAQAEVSGLTGEWATFEGHLEVPESVSPDVLFRFTLTAANAGQIVLGRLLLSPADHVQGCDPDVIRFLQESKLPLLRWPGGNFVSGYHWEDGIGPRDERPTLPNPAWGGVEPNLFGTDEFIEFCRAVGCEPMICINGGDGTQEEAARWIEYCNGSVDTPMGALRFANGYPEPFGVRYWEVGNELWGTWQVHWTTAPGYVDRYRRFAPAMLAADPTIHLYACGAPVLWGREWNDTLFAGTAPDLPATTDHPLIGGAVTTDTDPMDVYRDFMGVPAVLERRWNDLWQSMKAASIEKPELAITELQLFARLAPPPEGREATLTHDQLVTPGTLCEATYDLLVYHAAVRLAPFVKIITHSATVNHGGGLRKHRERVYANPCHYAQAMFAEFADATPVAVHLRSAVERMPVVLGDLKNANEGGEYPVADVLAAVSDDGTLLVSLVHRGSFGPLQLDLSLEGFEAGAVAQVESLSAPFPWSANTDTEPEAIVPVTSTATIENNRISLSLPLGSVTLMRVPPA